MTLLLIALLGCGPEASTAVDQPSDCSDQTHLVVATSDYSVGALATIELDTLEVHDELAATSGDPVVVVDDCEVYQINRTAGVVRRYAAGVFSAPEAEFALPGANPHDVARIGHELWVSRYEEAVLGVHDLDGGLLAEIDLSPWADGDGNPEADALVEWEGRLFLGLQRLDRDAGWTSESGLVLEIEPTTREVIAEWPTGPNPRLHHDADGLVVLTGHFTTYDGGFYRLDPDGAGLEEVLSGAESEAVFASFASAGDTSVLLAANVDNQYEAWCLPRGGLEPQKGWQTRQFLADIAVSRDFDVFIGVSEGWPPTGEPTGVMPLDSQVCTPKLAEPVVTFLDPHSLAIF